MQAFVFRSLVLLLLLLMLLPLPPKFEVALHVSTGHQSIVEDKVFFVPLLMSGGLNHTSLRLKSMHTDFKQNMLTVHINTGTRWTVIES